MKKQKEMTQPMGKYVYLFGGGKADGSAQMKELLGGKGANLAEMSSLKIPVPPGFTITTEMCGYYFKNKGKYPKTLEGQVEAGLASMEKLTGTVFGDAKNPLLVSVRSGAPDSMPGMMDTVLNLGLNDKIAARLVELSGDERFVYDAYRRFVTMYGDVVLGIERGHFEEALESKKKARGLEFDYQVPAEDLKDLVKIYKAIVKKETGKPFPETPRGQLWGAVSAVFGSWNNPRAIAYRELNKIPEKWGTAVNVQAMVFGNMGPDCATGVAFTRNAATGENHPFGEWLPNAQGEDVVAGIRTPLRLDKAVGGKDSLEVKWPKLYKQLIGIMQKLERHYRDMQDIEFTIQKGKLWMLQTRNGKRTGFAAIRIAVDLVDEKRINKKVALMRVDPEQINQLLQPVFNTDDLERATSEGHMLAKGLPAGPGAATGRIVFTAAETVEWAKGGEPVILVRIETSPEDIRGMDASKGILTARGGMTSHAALVARQMGKVCVAGCGDLDINYKKKKMKVKGRTFKQGDWISIDGTAGKVYSGEIKTKPSDVARVLFGEGKEKLKPEDSPIFQRYDKLLTWADEIRKLDVRANADMPDQASNAVDFGAQGIGLCRTEHMFLGPERIRAVRKMILAKTPEERSKALAKLLPMQRKDFAGIFKAMEGRPVTIRTLDPPLHEFLPHSKKEVDGVAKDLGVSVSVIKKQIETLREANPMLGHRGCRLGIVYPEITRTQAQAIFEAACDVEAKGTKVKPEIMIPLVGHVNELKAQVQVVRDVAGEVFKRRKRSVDYLVGTMIELPRAALTADEIATVAEFFSFGTNDLTQTTFGLSRDDAGVFLQYYLENGLLEADPFQTIDVKGVGELMRIGVEKGRRTNAKLKVGICGEHGGEPASVEFCHRLGLNYVSCSPFRIPIARIAAAQAVLREVK